jgi:hypothetical protein
MKETGTPVPVSLALRGGIPFDYASVYDLPTADYAAPADAQGKRTGNN